MISEAFPFLFGVSDSFQYCGQPASAIWRSHHMREKSLSKLGGSAGTISAWLDVGVERISRNDSELVNSI